ncbi:patatin-like phospholipase family protein [Microvirga sp. BT688]|uniref:patatin-like phospholipase family protein n=1 Tax=Microvirga sp. TaxID=1873136 RepID=UPI001687E7AE|nr:patatin-like phospholipase family protein [Microvirga sp.]MBD2747449.1 patatin-like phospholipase family protein [Microvirga sp.]
MTASSKLGQDQPLVLVLGGGNALGSYLAGAYEQLQQRRIEPQWIVGGSIGAVTGAIIAGNAPEDRLPRLKEFWDEAMISTPGLLGRGTKIRHTYNELHTITALLFGRPGLFGHRFPGMLSMLPWMPGDVALYDHRPLQQTLERLVDFDRLNRADIRLTIGCVDLESGEDVLFDNTRDTLTPEHFLASAAITPVFPPVEIGGRLLCDPGYTNNLPIEVPFAEPRGEDFTCIAVELFSLHASRPASLDSAAERANDMIFASPTHRALKGLKREYALREQLEPDGPQATLLHLAYFAGSDERAGKTFDYSPSSIRDRWAAGQRDMDKSLALLDSAPAERHRFRYLALSPEQEAASAEAGAVAARA